MCGNQEHNGHDAHWPQYSTEVAHHLFVTCFLFLLISQSFSPESCHPPTPQLHSLIPSFICPVFITPPPDWAKGGNWEQSMWSPSQTLHCWLVRSHCQAGRHTAPVCHSLYFILLCYRNFWSASHPNPLRLVNRNGNKGREKITEEGGVWGTLFSGVK